MRKVFAYGGVAASVVLMAFGVGALVVGFSGRVEVQDTIAREHIVGGDDMTPAAIKAGAEEAGLNVSSLDIPSMAVAGKEIDTGDEAKAFAGYMRIHALESTGGLTYAEMGRFQSAANPDDAAGTSDEEAAAKDQEGNPIPNSTRETWITATALTTALNTSFFAEQVANFSIVMGFALLLTGIGFFVLTLAGALGIVPIPQRKQSSTASAEPRPT